MSSLDLGGMLALVFVLSLGALVLVVWPALWLSGRISEREEEDIEQLRLGFAQGQDAAATAPRDNNRLSLGHRIEDDNAD